MRTCTVCSEHTGHQIRMCLEVSWCTCLDSDIWLKLFCLFKGFLDLNDYIWVVFSCRLQFLSHIFLFPSSLGLINQSLYLNQSVSFMAVSDATVLIKNISMSQDSIQQTAQRPGEWQAVQLVALPQRHLLWKRWYALRHHISRPSSLVIRALIATTRCKQHVILFVSHTVLFFLNSSFWQASWQQRGV